MIPAPIVLFVYNRPKHTRKTVESLQKNYLANASDLIIYSDAPKNSEAADAVGAVRAYIKTISGFRSVRIVERDRNWGLANSIIDGVTSVVNERGSIVVLEDDLVVSPHFLDFMNRMLERYEHEQRVWHISGWNYPIDPAGLQDAFFLRAMFCWGWATWADRWKHFRKEPERLIAQWDNEEIVRFNLDGKYNFWTQVQANASGEMNTWGVFWYASIFEHDALCLNPATTYVENIGLDSSGENCGESNLYSTQIKARHAMDFPGEISESLLALNRIKQFCVESRKPSLLRRIANTLGKARKARLFGLGRQG